MTDAASEDRATLVEDRFVARLQVKPPPFYKKSPELWFKQMESQFFLAGIQSSVTKYHHAMAALPEDVMRNIVDSLSCDYDVLKAAVLESLKANRFQLIDEAMSALELGDRKPSHLVNEIQRRFSEVGVKVDDTIVKSRLLSALPIQIRSALVGHEDADLKTFAKIADSMLAVLPSTTPFRVQHTAKAPEARANPRPQHSNGGPRPFYANQRQKVCNSHVFYGVRARTCRSWCQWPGNKPKILRPDEKTPSHSRAASPSHSQASSPPNE